MLVVLTDALQEVTSSAMFLAALAVVVALAGRLGAKLWTLVGAAAAAFAVHVSAGGLWNRSSLVVDNSGDGFLLATLRGMATSVPGLWTRAWPVWLVLIAALALHGLQPGTESPVRRALLTGSGTMLALALVCGEVQIPELLPHPSMAYSRAFYLERYEQAIADYYGLADGARIVNP